MFIVAWTVLRGEGSPEDRWITTHNRREAEEEAERLKLDADVYCWSIAQIVDSSEPQHVEG
ncbi:MULTISPECIES: hypothetical protein [unclassified Aminobacter]|uniref:hypothetical protein n=1 Tax=unclassified Aminobacter TaxID=2644704 RepID=UPI0004664DEF|nr:MULTISPECIES: hypothetical protein [unclassified Aminobacter]TWH35613.1 hypothetical protein L611_001200000940 [Aminobacter sp. J15]